VRSALQKIGRTDLIGTGPHCLIPPDHTAPKAKPKKPTIRQIHKKKVKK